MNRSAAVVLYSVLAAPAAAQQFVHLDGAVNNTSAPITLQLGAGCWRVTPIASTYVAFHPWNGANSGCGANGLNCSQGWATLYYMWSGPGGGQYGGTGFMSTPALALANSTPSTYWLPQAATVRFAVGDNYVIGNLGGISLRIDAIAGCSGPAALATYGSGTNGTAGVPALAGNDLPRLGDADFALQLSAAAPSSAMGWLIGWGQGSTPLPDFGATLLIDPYAYSIISVTDSTGLGDLPVPLDCDPALLCGLRFTCQAAVFDPVATGGVAFSNAVDVTIGS